MKKLILALVLGVMLPALALAADEGVQWMSAPYPIFKTSAVVTSDTAIKASPGYVRYMVCIGTDNSATAGTIALLDHTAAGGGTTVVTWTIQTTYNYATPVIFPVERNFTTAIYLDFTTTADIGCYVVYR